MSRKGRWTVAAGGSSATPGFDAGKLQRYYAELFDWNIDASNPMSYGLVKGEDNPSSIGSIGGGIGQSRVYMLLLRKAHLGEVSVTVWPQDLKQICAERNIHVLM